MQTNVTLFYVDHENTDRDQRWDAGEGKILPNGCYKAVASVALDHDSDDVAIAEAMFERFNIGDFCGLRSQLRSMSCGDAVVVDRGGVKTMLVCQGVGWKVVTGPEVLSTPALEWQTQDVEDDYIQPCSFNITDTKHIVATPGALRKFGPVMIDRALRCLYEAAKVQRLDYLQVFTDTTGERLWVIEDDQAITALLPEEY